MSALLFASALTPRAHAQTATQTLSGKIILDGWKGTYSSATIGNLTFTLAEKNSPRYIVKTVPYVASSNDSSEAIFSFAVPQGNYDVAVKAGRFLQAVNTANLTSGDVANFALQLEPGDLDGNNIDEVDDLFTLLLAFNTSAYGEGDPYDPSADLNGDGQISVDDLFALLLSFNVAGASTPTPVKWHIANVSLSTSGVVAGQTLTGVVTLADKAPIGGTTIILNNSALPAGMLLNHPTTVSIAAGATQSSPFSVTVVGTVSDTSYITLSASAYGWTQSATLTVVPSSTSLTVQNLQAVPGNQCVLVHWLQLPEGTVKGYRVYRNGVALNPVSQPLTSAIYADTDGTLTNGSQYQYKASVIDLQGNEGTSSLEVSVTPSVNIPSMNWINPPTNVSGTISLYAQLPTSGLTDNVLLVDGKISGYGATPTSNTHSTAIDRIWASLKSNKYTNGLHTIQIVGSSAVGTSMTPVITVNVTNDFSSVRMSNLLDTSDNSATTFQLSLPSGYTQWSAQLVIASPDYPYTHQIVGTWKGAGSTAKFCWNGKNETGGIVADEDGTVTISAQDSNGNIKSLGVPVAIFSRAPRGLALLTFAYPDNPAEVTYQYNLASKIRAAFREMKTRDSSFRGLTLLNDASDSYSPDMVAKIRKWICNQTEIFYIQSHGQFDPQITMSGTYVQGGTMAYTTWAGLKIRANIPSNREAYQFNINHPESSIIISQLNTSRDFKFVWIDCCHSAGGGSYAPNQVDGWHLFTPDLSSPDLFTWTYPFFRAGTGIGAFLGWVGTISANTNADGRVSKVYYWRERFWELLGNGYTISDSLTPTLTYANLPRNSTYDPSPEGWVCDTKDGVNRIQFFGNLEQQYP